MANAAVYLKPPPKIAPGTGMTELAHRAVQFSKSNTFGYSDGGSCDYTYVPVFTVPAHTMIVDLIVEKTVAFDASSDNVVVLGDCDVRTRFMAASDVDCANVGFRSIKGAEGSDQVGSGGYMYGSDGGTITVGVVAADASNGTLRVYCSYVSFADEL